MSKMKILLTRKLHDFALKELRKKYSVTVYSGKIPMPKKKLISQISDVSGLICFPYDIIDKEVIDSAKNLKCISTYSVGYDHVDVRYAKSKKICVGYTPEVLTEATADLAFSLMLDIMRRVTEGDRTIREGKWNQIYGAYDYVGVDIIGKTVGILGLGRIGKAFAKRAKAFDMNILYHNRHRISKKDEKKFGVKYVTLKKLFSQSDVISIHLPHTKETDKIIDMNVFKQMKKNSFLVNTARGKIINEKDLVLALKQKRIAGAALDVFDFEPISNKHPLAKMQNVVLAPHIGSSTIETREEMAKLAIKNLNLGMNGKKPIYSVGY